jgi:hypothetical protein
MVNTVTAVPEQNGTYYTESANILSLFDFAQKFCTTLTVGGLTISRSSYNDPDLGTLELFTFYLITLSIAYTNYCTFSNLIRTFPSTTPCPHGD